MEQFDTLRRQVNAPAAVSQFLTFTLGSEEYGIEILKVQEIRGYAAVTPMPNTPPFVKGVINLRGTIIPVIDLRLRFGLANAEYNRFNVIVVVTVGTRVMGLVVDAVSDVISIPTDDIQVPPDFGDHAGARAVNGLANAGEKVLLLLNIDRVLDGEAHPALEPARV